MAAQKLRAQLLHNLGASRASWFVRALFEMQRFRDASEELRKVCVELFALKKKGAAAVRAVWLCSVAWRFSCNKVAAIDAFALVVQNAAEIEELVTRGALLCQDIKASSRDALLTAQEHRERVQTAMAGADGDALQLDNLRYERSHLLREISKCKTFRCVCSLMYVCFCAAIVCWCAAPPRRTRSL